MSESSAASSGAEAPGAGGGQLPVFVAQLDARWGDLDAFNHVNNATYLTYLEQARLQWVQTLSNWYDAAAMPVLAASVLNYRRPIAWPERLAVELFCTRLGNTSITLAHRIVSSADPARLYCDGHVVMVWMNPATGKSAPLPASVRAASAAKPAE